MSDEKSNKKLSVSIQPSLEIKPYEFFIAEVKEGFLEVQLASKKETDKEIKINVENIFRIPEKRMYSFALAIIEAFPETKKRRETDEKS